MAIKTFESEYERRRLKTLLNSSLEEMKKKLIEIGTRKLNVFHMEEDDVHNAFLNDILGIEFAIFNLYPDTIWVLWNKHGETGSHSKQKTDLVLIELRSADLDLEEEIDLEETTLKRRINTIKLIYSTLRINFDFSEKIDENGELVLSVQFKKSDILERLPKVPQRNCHLQVTHPAVLALVPTMFTTKNLLERISKSDNCTYREVSF